MKMRDRDLCKAKRADDGEWFVGYIARYGHIGEEKKYYIIPCICFIFFFNRRKYNLPLYRTER